MIDNKIPGALKNNSKIIIHTVPAQKVLDGTQHVPIGLFAYCAEVMKVYRGALKKDPYAELFLLKIYEAGMLVRKKMRELIKQYTKILSDEVDGDGKIFYSNCPRVYSVNSINEYIMLGVILIKQFDYLMRLIFTSEKLLLVDKRETKTSSRNLRRRIRKFFNLPFHWHDFDITRADIHNDTDKAQKARKTMGKLHPDVLQGRLNAKYLL